MVNKLSLSAFWVPGFLRAFLAHGLPSRYQLPALQPALAFRPAFAVFFFRHANLVGSAKFSITSAGTSRPARYRLLASMEEALAPACAWLGRRHHVYPAKPYESTLEALLHVVQSPWFLHSFQMAFNRANSIQPVLSGKGRGYLGNKRLRAQRWRHHLRDWLRSAAPPCYRLVAHTSSLSH